MSWKPVQIVEAPIDSASVVESVASPMAGAIVTFDGTVRNHARGRRVTHLFYEAYPRMALSEMRKIRELAVKKWPLEAASIVHRVGRMEIGDSSILSAVSSAHRADAFEACRYIIDTIKTSVPIWKREFYADGDRWIEGYCGEAKSQ